MAADPNADPATTLSTVTTYWSDPAQQSRICQLTQEQAFNKSAAEAQQLCAVLPKPQMECLTYQAPLHLESLDDEIDRIRAALGPLDGREPDKIPSI